MTEFTTPPGAPGIRPRWTSSAKSAVGTAARAESQVWFTVSHGILNEIYARRLDQACVRDFGFIVTAKDYFSETKRDARHTVEMFEDGVPAFRLVNTAIDGRYRITKIVFSDPVREVVLQQLHFEALIGELGDYQLHAIVAPHLVNAGAGNTGWYGDFKGHQMLFAEGRGLSLAVASSVPDTGGVTVVPALTGLGAPWWQPDALVSCSSTEAIESIPVSVTPLRGAWASVTIWPLLRDARHTRAWPVLAACVLVSAGIQAVAPPKPRIV